MISKIRANSIIHASNAIKSLSYSKKSIINLTSKPSFPIINPGHSGTNLSIDKINDSRLSQSTMLSLNIDGGAMHNSNKSKFEDLMLKMKMVYPKVIKDLYADFSNTPKVIALEAQLKKLGVVLTSGDDYDTTLSIFNVFKKVKMMGLEIPHRLIFASFKPDNLLAYLTGMEKGYEKYATLLIRKNLAMVIKQNRINSSSLPNIEHILLHELGHYNFSLKSPNDKDMFKIYDKFVHTYSHHYINKHVSFNAITEPNGHEFIAEVFAGLVQGKKFPQPIVDCYNALGGPKIH